MLLAKQLVCPARLINMHFVTFSSILLVIFNFFNCCFVLSIDNLRLFFSSPQDKTDFSLPLPLYSALCPRSSSWSDDLFQLVSIHAVSDRESAAVHLVALTVSAIRLYFSCYPRMTASMAGMCACMRMACVMYVRACMRARVLRHHCVICACHDSLHVCACE